MSGEIATVNEQVSIAPATMVEMASERSDVLKDIVEKQGLSRNFGGKKNHLDYEAWVTIASLNGCTLGVEWSRPIMTGDDVKGFEARAFVRNAEGRELSTAEAECLFTERNWRGKPEFQLRSMAQTRACSKAARMVFSWYAVLAGYAATPAEEMDGVHQETPEAYQGSRKPEGKQRSDDTISPAQVKFVKMLMGKANMNADARMRMKKDYGVKVYDELTRNQLNSIKQKLIDNGDIFIREVDGKDKVYGKDEIPPDENPIAQDHPEMIEDGEVVE